MFSKQMFSRRQSNEKLRVVFRDIRHCQSHQPSLVHRKTFIFQRLGKIVDRGGKRFEIHVATLDHEIFNDTVKMAPLVALGVIDEGFEEETGLRGFLLEQLDDEPV
jgi:hypothetical protein